MSGVRQAAMVLHGLGDADREWMLSRLPPSRVDELRPLLDELRELGMPTDAELIAQAVDGAQAAAPTPQSQDAARIAGASAAQMLALLRGEPDRLVALVTSSSAWPWRDAFFGQLGPHRAARLRDLSLAMGAPPALRAAVLQALAERLRKAEADDPRPTAARRPARWSLAGLHHRWLRGRPSWLR